VANFPTATAVPFAIQWPVASIRCRLILTSHGGPNPTVRARDETVTLDPMSQKKCELSCLHVHDCFGIHLASRNKNVVNLGRPGLHDLTF
jgi:hypothetical protein